MKKNIGKIILYIVNIVLGIITIAPILYALAISFMPPDQIFSYPPKLIPKELYLKNYLDALNAAPIIKFIINSFVVSLGVTAGVIITSCLAAFSFSFFNFRGKKILFVIVIATMMIPAESIMISNYLTVGSFGWLDSYKALVIPYLSAAMGVFMMRQYYLTLPKELYEAAKIDGCNSFKFFTRIVFPMSRPIVLEFPQNKLFQIYLDL